MPESITLSRQTAVAIYEYTNTVLSGVENENFMRRHNEWVNAKSVPKFFHDFIVVMTRLGVNAETLNDELCLWLTSCITQDFSLAWYDRRDIYYIAHNYYQYVTDGAVSPFHDTDVFSILGDLFNNFPLTIEGKIAADTIHELVIGEFQSLLRSVCVSMALEHGEL